MELLTKVNTPESPRKLGLENKIMIIGSCFANEIGSILKSCGFNISVNPFGTLYNPISIANSIERLASATPFEAKDVINITLHSTSEAQTSKAEISKPEAIAQGYKYCSFFHHSSFAKNSAEEFLAHANLQLAKESVHFKNCDTVIITLGTSWVFRHERLDEIVSNCHKIHPKEFTREFIPLNTTSEILQKLISKYPDKNFIFTVSPIRHLKDGAHGNQISKTSLLLAVEQLVANNPDTCSYFPAYEIMLDELRDYRFYAEDMVHPSELAVKYIYNRFKEWCINPAEYQSMQQKMKEYKQRLHRQML
jgi:hypothetical protein